MGCANCKLSPEMMQKIAQNGAAGPLEIDIIKCHVESQARINGPKTDILITANIGEQETHKFPVGTGANIDFKDKAVWKTEKKPEEDDLVLFHIWAVEEGQDDEVIGECHYSLKPIQKGGIQTRIIEFHGPHSGVQNGTIEVKFTFEPKAKDKNPLGAKDPNGMIQIQILEAELNRDETQMNKLSPQFVFECGENRVKSSVQFNAGLKPKWDNDVLMLNRHWTDDSVRMILRQRQQWGYHYQIGFNYISLSLPIATKTKAWYQLYDKGVIVGKVQLAIDFFDRPEKSKKARHKKNKRYEMLPEQKKQFQEDQKKRREARREKKKADPKESVTSDTNSDDDFTNTSSLDSRDVDADKDCNDYEENEVQENRQNLDKRTDSKLDKAAKKGFRQMPTFVKNQFKDKEKRQKMLDEKVKPKAKEKIDEITPPWETAAGEEKEFDFFEKQAHYKGEFKSGKRHGKGTLEWITGQKYTGEWKRGRMHGNGTLTTSVWTYKGDFAWGRVHGVGEMWSNQFKWNGSWRNGRKAGKVHITDLRDNKNFTGEFHKKEYYFEGWTDGDMYEKGRTSSILRDGHEDTQLWSENGFFCLKVNYKGRLILRKKGVQKWASTEVGDEKDGPFCFQIKDGNFRVISNKGTVHFETKTGGKGESAVMLENDGQFFVKTYGGEELYKSTFEQDLLGDAGDLAEQGKEKAEEMANKLKDGIGKLF